MQFLVPGKMTGRTKKIQKTIDPDSPPAMLSLPPAERQRGIDLKRTLNRPGFRDEKFATAPSSN
jgi:hypothetical protein